MPARAAHRRRATHRSTSYPITDQFTDLDGVLLQAHKSLPWVKHPGAAVDAAILTNKLRGAAGLYHYLPNVTPTDTSYETKATLKLESALGAAEHAGVGVRCSQAADTGYFVRVHGTNGWELVKRVAGVETVLDTEPWTHAVGDEWAVAIGVEGSKLAATASGPQTNTIPSTADGSFEQGTIVGWSADAFVALTTFAQSTFWASRGTKSVRMTVTDATPGRSNGVRMTGNSVPTRAPVVGGSLVRFSVDLNVLQTLGHSFSYRWFTGAGVLISSGNVPSVPKINTGEHTMTADITAPPTAAYVAIGISCTSGGTFDGYMDNFQVGAPGELSLTATDAAIGGSGFAGIRGNSANVSIDGFSSADIGARGAGAFAWPLDGVVVANARFASPTGNDTTGDGSIGNPWQSANKLVTETPPGYTGYFRAGTYAGFVSSPWAVLQLGSNGASQGAKIQIRNYPGELVEIRGPWKVDGNWLQVFGLVLNTWAHAGAVDREEPLWFRGSDCEVAYCDITSNDPADPTGIHSTASALFLGYSPIGMRNDRFWLHHSWLHDVHWYPPGQPNQPHGCYASYCDSPLFENNKIWGMDQVGQCGLQLYPQCTNATVRNNVFDNCWNPVVMGTQFAGQTGTGHRVTANIFTNGASNKQAVGTLWSDTEANPAPAGTVIVVEGNQYFSFPAGFNAGNGMTLTGNVAADPGYTNPAGHVYFPYSGAVGKGTNW